MKHEKFRILIVEDRPEDRELIEHELTQAKVLFESCWADNRESFLKEVKDFAPDIVLCDFALPQFDAMEAMGILRRYRPDVPFVLVTGAQSEEIAVECMKRGADDFILKSTLRRLPSAVLNAVKGRDIRRAKEMAEKNLRAQEAQVRLIAEHTLDLIYLLDQKGQFIYANPSFKRSLGLDPEELLGKKAFSLVHPDDRTVAREAFHVALESQTDRTVQFRYKIKEGAWRLFESVINWAIDEKGVPVKAVVVARDIEERKRLEDQVRQAQKMEAVGRLAGGVAHDFNNLLTAINGYSDLLLRSLDRMDPRRSDVEEIKETAGRAATLTQQLLAFSRRQITQPTVLDMNQVVTNLEKMLRRLIGEDIQLKTVREKELYRVRVDMGQLEQVLLNLSVNARDAMPKGGTLTIETSNRDMVDGEEVPRGAYSILIVTDSGTGMDPATMAHLYEPFFTTKEKGRGTGLGLSTVYGIVHQSGGHIRVTTNVGEGTSFRLYFPRVEEVLSVQEKSTETDEFFKGNETVLLVEDDRSVRTLAARVLAASGYQVLEAASGEEALRMVRDNSLAVDILVTDVVMNGMTGTELARQFVAAFPLTKVLYLSGYMESDTRNSILREVQSSFLGKPFRPRDLVQKVRQTIDGSTDQPVQEGGSSS
ncbi:MAG: response regulator [Elusimicrobia bacterium]|jgi:two-component system cell cycle sensor histidine kinase/response regulator CckA|nr:response regulator [Elusimicrobiota bacterium]